MCHDYIGKAFWVLGYIGYMVLSIVRWVGTIENMAQEHCLMTLRSAQLGHLVH